MGDPDGTRAAIERLAARTDGAVTIYRASVAPGMVRLAVAIGDVGSRPSGTSRRWWTCRRCGNSCTPTARAPCSPKRRAPADAADRYRDVTVRWQAYGDPYEEAQALLGLARTAGDEAAAERAASVLDGLGVGREGGVG